MTKTFIPAALAAAAVVGFGAGAQAQEGWPSSLEIGTASIGGTYYVYGQGWANLIAEETGLSVSAEVTGGPVQNMTLVETGEVPLALTTLGPAAEALAGNSPLAPGLDHANVRALFPMYQTPFSFTASAASGISEMSEIPDGSRIGFGPAGSTADVYFTQFLDTLGVNYERQNGSWSDLVGQMQDGLIDAIAFAAGVPIPAVGQLEAQMDINLVAFTDEELETILAEFPVSEFVIPADTYQSLSEDQTTVAMWNFAITHADLPEDLAYAVMEAALSDHQAMLDVHQTAEETIPENVDKNAVLPYHPGAVRWYEENGFEVPENVRP